MTDAQHREGEPTFHGTGRQVFILIVRVYVKESAALACRLARARLNRNGDDESGRSLHPRVAVNKGMHGKVKQVNGIRNMPT